MGNEDEAAEASLELMCDLRLDMDCEATFACTNAGHTSATHKAPTSSSSADSIHSLSTWRSDSSLSLVD